MKKNRFYPIPAAQFVIALTWLALLIITPPLGGESPHYTLPLGPSPHKFIIDKIEAGQIIRTADGQTVGVSDIIAGHPDADVFIIGEAHDNYHCHVFQRDFIAALIQKHPKVIVGFEFFQREDNPVLEQWRTGAADEKTVLEKTGWYKRSSQNHRLTQLIMNLIREKQLKVIGLNIPRTILNTVSRKGFSQLTPEEKTLFPTLPIVNREHEYFIKSIFGTFAAQVPMWFANIYAAQTCWDVVMAESMRMMLSQKPYKGYKGVIIAGSNHVAYKLGIPFRYNKAAPGARIITIVPVLAPQEQKEDNKKNSADGEEAHPMMRMLGGQLPPAATFSRGLADYVFSAPQPLLSHFPSLGAAIEQKNGQLIITSISTESFAEKNGLRKGDIIHSIDHTDLTTLEQLRLILNAKNWNDEILLGVAKTIALTRNDTKEENKHENKDTGPAPEKTEKGDN